MLRTRGWKAQSIHGNVEQNIRTNIMKRFKSGQDPLLVATDVAARGLDIPDVEYVINLTFPTNVEDYVHRIGRTGRGGKTGIAHSFFTSADKARAKDLIKVLRESNQHIPEALWVMSRANVYERKFKGRGGGYGFNNINNNIINNNTNNTNNNNNSYSRDHNTTVYQNTYNKHIQQPQVTNGTINSLPTTTTNTVLPPWAKPYTKPAPQPIPPPYWHQPNLMQQQQQWPQSGNGIQLPLNIVHPKPPPNSITTNSNNNRPTGFSSHQVKL